MLIFIYSKIKEITKNKEVSMYLFEFIGTAVLVLLGCGAIANNHLPKTGGNNTGTMFINTGWGFAVFVAVLMTGWKSGAHINPAVTIAVAVRGSFDWNLVPFYILAQCAGAFFGAFIVWCAYKKHYDESEDSAKILGTFSTGASIRNGFWNIVTEIIATFVLVLGIILFGVTENAMPPWAAALTVGFLVWAIGISLGGPTGYAINPARDLGPRMFHAVAFIPNKGSSNWKYGLTVPIIGPIIGGILAAITSTALGV